MKQKDRASVLVRTLLALCGLLGSTGALAQLAPGYLTPAVGLHIEAFQTNHEGELVDAIHRARGRCSAIIINPGAFTHYAWSLHDALAAFTGPVAVMVGDEDTVTPVDVAGRTAGAARDAVLVVIPGVGHLSAVEDPAAVAAALEALAARADAAG